MVPTAAVSMGGNMGRSCMIRLASGMMALIIDNPALAQQAPTTGSPSNGTATVSPTTASDALGRPALPAPSLDLSLGTSIASGDFGGPTRSDIWSTSFGARYATAGGLRLSMSIPYMRIRSNGTVFTGIDSTPVIVAPSVAGPRRTARGFGDLTLGASYTVEAPASVELELSGRVKVPTATDSSGLSSGKVDYSVGAQLSKAFGRVAPFVSTTYRVFGDPRGFDLRDGIAISAGASVIVDDRTVLLMSYHFSQAATRLVSDAQELFAGASTQLGQSRLRLTGFATAGLSNGAPGLSGGVAVSMTL